MLHCNNVAMHKYLSTNLGEIIMNNAIYENLSKVSKSSYDAAKELFEINANIAEQLIEQQLAIFNLGVEYTSRQLALAGQAKGYKEVVSSQTEITSDIIGKAQGIARNSADIISESKDEVNVWFEKGVKEAEKCIQEVAKVTPFTKAA